MPEENRNLVAKVIMKEFPVTLRTVPTVKEVSDALFHGYRVFPVLNKSRQLVGQISSDFLIVLIKHRNWYTGLASVRAEAPTGPLAFEGQEGEEESKVEQFLGEAMKKKDIDSENDV